MTNVQEKILEMGDFFVPCGKRVFLIFVSHLNKKSYS